MYIHSVCLCMYIFLYTYIYIYILVRGLRGSTDNVGPRLPKFDQNCSKFDRSRSADRKRWNLDQTSAAFVRISSKIAQNFSRMWSNWLKMLQNSTFWDRFSYFFEVAVRARLDLQRREPNPCFCWQVQYFQGFADFADRSKIHQN